jgi:LPXTG-site transpeptidase (sortase) family protein
VITGHSVHGPATGALERIAELQAGATVLVRTDRRLLRYTVTRVETLDKDALTVRAQRLFSPHGRARLVLVTCGDWDGRHYRSNVVAVALPAAGDQGGAGE